MRPNSKPTRSNSTPAFSAAFRAARSSPNKRSPTLSKSSPTRQGSARIHSLRSSRGVNWVSSTCTKRSKPRACWTKSGINKAQLSVKSKVGTPSADWDSLKTLMTGGSFVWGAWGLFPFDGGRRFAADVVYHPVDAAHFVDDAAADARQHRPGDVGPIRSHGVRAGHATHRAGELISALVAHDADATHGQEHRESLPKLAVKAGCADSLGHNGVRLAQKGQFRLGHFAQTADRSAGTRKGMAPDEGFGKPQGLA